MINLHQELSAYRLFPLALALCVTSDAFRCMVKFQPSPILYTSKSRCAPNHDARPRTPPEGPCLQRPERVCKHRADGVVYSRAKSELGAGWLNMIKRTVLSDRAIVNRELILFDLVFWNNRLRNGCGKLNTKKKCDVVHSRETSVWIINLLVGGVLSITFIQ